MRNALALYQNAMVRANHPPDRSMPAAGRDVDDTFGVTYAVKAFRNSVRICDLMQLSLDQVP